MTDTTLPSEAKITLQAYGNSLPQLFENTAHELFKILINPEDIGEALREKVVIEAVHAEGLLHEWVNALLRLATDQHILYKKSRFQVFEVERTGSGKLRAEVTGELVDPVRHTFRKEPRHWICERVELLNNSKTIEAKIFLSSGPPK